MSQPLNTYTLDIQNRQTHYETTLYKNGNETGRTESALGEKDTVSIHTDIPDLGSLVNGIITYDEHTIRDILEERGQLEVGKYLWDQTFGKIMKNYPDVNNDKIEVDISIVTDDEFIIKLPWTLLYYDHKFISQCNCHIFYSCSREYTGPVFKLTPGILIIAPETHYRGQPVYASGHIQTLKSIFGKDNVSVITTLEECTAIKPGEYSTVYFYGHGVYDGRKTRLLFEHKSNGFEDVTIPDLVRCIKPCEPKILYINCCYGDAGGALGIGMQFRQFVPAVITNRTKAPVDVSKKYAEAILKEILLNDTPPHKAVQKMYSEFCNNTLTAKDIRWINPVLHRNYSMWLAKRRKKSVLIHDPHWSKKFDRVAQFGTIRYLTEEMMQYERTKLSVFLWYGIKGQGTGLFHGRISVELMEKFKKYTFKEVKPVWPSVFEKNIDPENPAALIMYKRVFTEMIADAFSVAVLEHVPLKIREWSRGKTGEKVLVVIHHETIRDRRILPGHIKMYISWLDTTLVKLLDENHFLLAAVSFEVKRPSRFREHMLDTVVARVNLDRGIVRLLDEMEAVNKNDISDFFHIHNITLPPDLKNRIIDEVLKKTKGSFEQTINELRIRIESLDPETRAGFGLIFIIHDQFFQQNCPFFQQSQFRINRIYLAIDIGPGFHPVNNGFHKGNIFKFKTGFPVNPAPVFIKRIFAG